MSDKSNIEWTDATWNPITGCSVVSPGCTNCYAMKLAGGRMKHHPTRAGLTRESKAGPVWTGETRLNEGMLADPLRWKRPRRIFVCAHGDLFHQSVPDKWIDRVFAVMAHCPRHTFQVLTKRPARMLRWFEKLQQEHRWAQIHNPGKWSGSIALVDRSHGWPLSNVWLGVSVEDQARADERIPDLLATPAAVRFLSCEPLLGPVELGCALGWIPEESLLGELGKSGRRGIEWIICGGESGSGARPMHPTWARSLRDQCAAAGVPFFFKQWGEYRPCTAVELKQACGATLVGDRSDGAYMMRVGKKRAGRLLDGVTHDAMPGFGPTA